MRSILILLAAVITVVDISAQSPAELAAKE